MVCRSTPGNSAITTMARNTSNLHDVQVLSLFHETRSEAPRSTPAPTPAERARFLRAHSLYATENYPDMPERRRRDLLNRIQEARETNVDGRTYYAWQNIEQRAVFARTAMETHFAAIARRHGYTPERVEQAFNQLMHRDHRLGGSVPDAPEHLPFATTNLPRDRGTRYALAMLHAAGPDVTTDNALAIEVYEGIHADSARLAANPELNPANQCPDCGQFAGDGHVCPHVNAANQSYAQWIADEIASEDVDVQAANRLHNAALMEAAAHAEALESAEAVGQSLIDRGRERLAATTETAEEAAAREALAEWEAELLGQVAAETAERERAEQGLDHPVFTDAELAATDTALNFASMTEPERASAAQYLRASRESDPNAPFLPGEEEFLSSRTPEGDAAILRQARADAALGTGADLTEEQNARRYARIIRDSDPNRPLDPWEAELLNPQPTDSESAAEAAANAPETPAAPVRRRNPMRNYRPDPDTVVRTMNMSAVRAELRDNPTYTMQDVTVSFDEEQPDDFTHHVVVTGSVEVANTGQRRTRTRDRYTVSAGSPSSDPDYEPSTRTLRCNCAVYRANYDCTHIRQATEQIAALVNQREPVAVAPAAAMDNVGAALRDEYDASLAAAQEARADFDAAATTDISYAENMSAFQSSWDEAKAHFEADNHKLPYMYENATNGLGAREGGRSIGIEIEVDFPDDMSYTAKARVAQEIYEAGLSDSPQVRPWHWRARQTGPRGQSYGGGYTDNPNMWSVEHDSSVDDVGGRRGCEIVSPILYDTPETWRNLEKICEIVERNGGKVTPRTGLHINIGAADFDHTVGNHNRLIGIANAYEDVIVRTAHNPASGPNHRGRDYCRPMTMPEEGFTSIRQAQRSIDPQNYEGSSHRAMINLDHVPAEGAPVQNSTRVEVRIFDGSIDPGRIQANVKLSLGMVNAAVRGVDVPRDQERAGTHRNANAGANGRMRRLRGEEWERDTASFRRFADTLFTRPEDKRQLTFAFAASRWQRR